MKNVFNVNYRNGSRPFAYFLIFCIIVAIIAGIFGGCGDDNPTTPNNPNNPTLQDSIIKLKNPQDSAHYFMNDSFYYAWNKPSVLAIVGFRMYVDTSENFPQNSFTYYNVEDTTLAYTPITFPDHFKYYWKVVPDIFNDTNEFRYQSEIRMIEFN